VVGDDLVPCPADHVPGVVSPRVVVRDQPRIGRGLVMTAAHGATPVERGSLSFLENRGA
jgi:hypothetical protein